jgi:hypothetical protein
LQYLETVEEEAQKNYLTLGEEGKLQCREEAS